MELFTIMMNVVLYVLITLLGLEIKDLKSEIELLKKTHNRGTDDHERDTIIQ